MEMQEAKKRNHDNLKQNQSNITIIDDTDVHNNENGKIHTNNGKRKKFLSKKRILNYGLLFLITLCIMIIAFIFYCVNSSSDISEKSKGIGFVKNSTIITNINEQTTKMYESAYQTTVSVPTPTSEGKMNSEDTMNPTTEQYFIDSDKGDRTVGKMSTENAIKVETTEGNINFDYNTQEQTSTVQNGYKEYESPVITSTSDYGYGTTDNSDWPPYPDMVYEDTTPSDDEIGSGNFDDEDYFAPKYRIP